MRHRALPATKSAPRHAGRVSIEVTATGWILRIPGLRLVCEANARDHWGKKSSRFGEQYMTLGMALNVTRPEKPTLPCDIYFTRIAPGTLDRFVNLPSSMKAIEDEFARWIGVDDSDERVRYHAKQRKAGPRVYGVEIEAVWKVAKKSA